MNERIPGALTVNEALALQARICGDIESAHYFESIPDPVLERYARESTEIQNEMELRGYAQAPRTAIPRSKLNGGK